MTTAPLFLIAAALADWFISLRPLKSIAGRAKIEPGDLQKRFPTLALLHTFRGQLQAALSKQCDHADE